MRFYTRPHKHYGGINLHARKIYVCIVNQCGKVKVHKIIKTNLELFFELIFAYRDYFSVRGPYVFRCIGGPPQ